MLVPPTFGALLTMSGSTPVPPGPTDLDYNKFFIVDDRYDDGWTQYGLAGTVSGGEFIATESFSETGIRRNNSPDSASFKIRAKFVITGGGSSDVSTIVVDKDNYNTAAGITLNGDDYTVSASYNLGVGATGGWVIPTGKTSGDYVWLELEHVQGVSLTFRVFDDSFSMIDSRSSGAIPSWSSSRFVVKMWEYPGAGSTVKCDQVSYDR